MHPPMDSGSLQRPNITRMHSHRTKPRPPIAPTRLVRHPSNNEARKSLTLLTTPYSLLTFTLARTLVHHHPRSRPAQQPANFRPQLSYCPPSTLRSRRSLKFENAVCRTGAWHGDSHKQEKVNSVNRASSVSVIAHRILCCIVENKSQNSCSQAR